MVRVLTGELTAEKLLVLDLKTIEGLLDRRVAKLSCLGVDHVALHVTAVNGQCTGLEALSGLCGTTSVTARSAYESSGVDDDDPMMTVCLQPMRAHSRLPHGKCTKKKKKTHSPQG
jgi:hypothetical protein